MIDTKINFSEVSDCCQEYLDAGNMNPTPKRLENWLIDWELMEIQFVEKFLPIIAWKHNWSSVLTSHLGIDLKWE